MARILLIDDDDKIREVVRRILTHEGHDIVEAEDGAEAFQQLIDGGFDLIITDILMPDMDGIEFLQLLDNLENPAPPVLAVSGGMAAWSPLPTAQFLGATHTLAKPFAGKELIEAVRWAVEGPNR